MKKIKLTQGKYALVDDEDYERISKVKWCANWQHTQWVAVGIKGIRMSHFILGKPKKGKVIDHKNGNTLDNRKSNLRFATHRQNSYNRKVKSDSKTRVKGVHYHKVNKKWIAYTGTKKGQKYIGSFKNKIDAVNAYNKASIKIHKQFSITNRH